MEIICADRSFGANKIKCSVHEMCIFLFRKTCISSYLFYCIILCNYANIYYDLFKIILRMFEKYLKNLPNPLVQFKKRNDVQHKLLYETINISAL